MTTPAWIAQLSDADLIAAASKLTFSRAQRAVTPPEIESDDNGCTVRWADATCHLPASGLPSATCTCPARKLCLHRVRSVLYLRARAGPPDATAWTPSFGDDELAREAGPNGVRRAAQLLLDGVRAVYEPTAAVVFPDLGVRVRFAPDEALSAAACSCGRREVCVHRVMGALSFRARRDLERLGAPTIDDTAVIDDLVALARDIAATGLDHLPDVAREALLAGELAATGASFPNAARGLRRLARLLAAYHERSARFDGGAWLEELTALAARLGAARRFAHDPDRPTLAVVGCARAQHLPVTRVALIGLGAEGAASDRGSLVRSFFASDGRIVSAVLGRGEERDPQRLYELPLWDRRSPRELAGKTFRLGNGRVAASGALAAEGDARVERVAAAPPIATLSGVVTSRAELAHLCAPSCVPALLAERRAVVAVIAVDAQQRYRPRFDAVRQTLELGVRLASGESVSASLPYRAHTARRIAALEALPRWLAAPSHLLARVSLGATTDGKPCRGLRIDPIAAWTGTEPRPISLDFDAPDLTLREVHHEGNEAELPPPDTRLVALATMRDELAGWLIGGLEHGPAWRGERAHRAAAELARVGLEHGAALLLALAEDPALETLVAATAWLLSVEDALQRELLPVSH